MRTPDGATASGGLRVGDAAGVDAVGERQSSRPREGRVTTTETTAALRARLEAVPLFAHCAPSDLAIVAQRSEIRDVVAGTPIIEAGALGEEFYVLLSGAATVSRNGVTVATLESGDHFGELALLDP